ncbi:sensor domain-containing diguanylate cyclase [Aestuariibacter salexigens]|uniref:sensor domain-containing diguanylate cyclase n=1 Tax=Aestuariibacter salexigens TaxID=226010 RepID=UPI00146FA6A0|nr:diguanylate cyclase [Aestuariibacter salexigens]
MSSSNQLPENSSLSDTLACVLNKDGGILSASTLWSEYFPFSPSKQKEYENFVDWVVDDDKTCFNTIIGSIQYPDAKPLSAELTLINNERVGITLCPLSSVSPSKFLLFATPLRLRDVDKNTNKKTNDLLNAIVSALKIGIWQYDTRNQELKWSDEIYDIHGLDKTLYQPTLESAIDHYHPSDIRQVKKLVNDALNKRQEYTARLKVVREDKTIRNIITGAKVLEDSRGELTQVYGFVQDITALHQSTIRSSLLATAISSTSVGICITDQRRRIVWVNAGFEKLTGYNESDVLGKPLPPLVQGPETSKATVRQIHEKLEHGENIETEILNYHADGSLYWIKLTITPIFNDGAITHFVGLQQDISEQVHHREELDALRLSLEQQIAERTKELEEANRELHQLAHRDQLTGALNRRAFNRDYVNECKRAQRYETWLSIACLDIDHFKSINDTYGHQTGDSALVSVVKRIQSAMRETDNIYRMGGEEFIILMPHTNAEDAEIASERMRHAVAQTDLTISGISFPISISIGLLSQKGELSENECLTRVDKCLYRAKANGRNCVVACHC